MKTIASRTSPSMLATFWAISCFDPLSMRAVMVEPHSERPVNHTRAAADAKSDDFGNANLLEFHALAAQRKNWLIAGGGYGIHLPAVDEDLSTPGLLHGAPAARGKLRKDM